MAGCPTSPGFRDVGAGSASALSGCRLSHLWLGFANVGSNPEPTNHEGSPIIELRLTLSERIPAATGARLSAYGRLFPQSAKSLFQNILQISPLNSKILSVLACNSMIPIEEGEGGYPHLRLNRSDLLIARLLNCNHIERLGQVGVSGESFARLTLD